MSNQGGSFKMLLRNLRTKNYEKVHFIRNDASLVNGEESKKGEVRPKKNLDLRKKRNG